MSAPAPQPAGIWRTAVAWLNVLANFEQHAPRITFLPAWANVVGWAYHLVIGTTLSFLPNGGQDALWLGIGHEIADGDLLGPTGPWDGLLDIACFVIPTIVRGIHHL